MQTSSISGGYGSSELRELLRVMQSAQASGAGQNVQAANDSQGAAPTEEAQAASSTPAPGADAASQFATRTLASLLDYQQQSAWASSTASQLIGQLDGDGNGELSLSEVEKALGSSSQQSGLSQAFAQIDSNGDGQISQSELSAAISNEQHANGGLHGILHGHVHRQGHMGPGSATASTTSTQMATDIIDALDPNGGGSLSLQAIEQDLGLIAPSTSASQASGTSSSTAATQTSAAAAPSTPSSTPSSPLAASVSQAFSKLDTDGDGQISVSELASAIQAFRQAQEASWSSAWTSSMAGLSAAV